jgi:hypothetical protein
VKVTRPGWQHSGSGRWWRPQSWRQRRWRKRAAIVRGTAWPAPPSVAHTGCPGWWPVGQSKITMSTHFIARHLVFYSAYDTRHSELKPEDLGHLRRLLTNHGSKHFHKPWIQAFPPLPCYQSILCNDEWCSPFTGQHDLPSSPDWTSRRPTRRSTHHTFDILFLFILRLELVSLFREIRFHRNHCQGFSTKFAHRVIDFLICCGQFHLSLWTMLLSFAHVCYAQCNDNKRRPSADVVQEMKGLLMWSLSLKNSTPPPYPPP